jgi:hypothetical protein
MNTKIEISGHLHLPKLGTARGLTNTSGTTTTLDENRVALTSWCCFVIAAVCGVRDVTMVYKMVKNKMIS